LVLQSDQVFVRQRKLYATTMRSRLQTFASALEFQKSGDAASPDSEQSGDFIKRVLTVVVGTHNLFA